MFTALYCLLLTAIIVIEKTRKKDIPIDCLTLFSIFFVLSYVMPGLLWSLLGNEFIQDTKYILNYNAAKDFELYIILSLSFITFSFCYIVFKKVKFNHSLKIKLLYDEKTTNDRMLYIFGLYGFIICVSIIISGGINNYIVASLEGRHNNVYQGLVGYLNYLISPANFIAAGCLFFLFNRKKYKLEKTKTIVTFLILSACLIGLIAKGGRASIVYALLYTALLMYQFNKKIINAKNIFAFFLTAIGGLFIISYLRRISNNLMFGREALYGINWDNFIDNTKSILIAPFKYYNHYFYTITEFLKDPDIYNFPRLGVDTLSGLILLVPGIKGEDYGLPPLLNTTNQKVMGYFGGSIPPGWIAWALIDGHVIFLILKLTFASFICAWIDKSWRETNRHLDLNPFVYLMTSIILLNFILSATPTNLFRGSIGDFLIILMFFFIPYIRLFKVQLIYRR